MKLEKIIGRNVAELRNKWSISQPELGERVGKELGKKWSRQTVSAVENGERAFTAVDLVILAHVLQVPVNALLRAPEGAEVIDVGIKSFSPDQFDFITWQSDDSAKRLADAARTMQALDQTRRDIAMFAEQQRVLIDDTRQAMLGKEPVPAPEGDDPIEFMVRRTFEAARARYIKGDNDGK